MNDAHHTYRRNGGWYFPELQTSWFDEHPEALLPNRTLDYVHPDVHAYRKRQIGEVLEKYPDVTGIDLDFTRFAPWFREGEERAGMPKMTQLVRELRGMTRQSSKTLSARFEYDPSTCIASGLDLETMLRDGLFDQITLGVTGSHTPDASIDWWVQRTRLTGCKLCPGMEGVLHWIPACGWGGAGTLPGGDGVHDGCGPPSLAYMRAVAGTQYGAGADGVSLFNFTCADGPFPRAAFTELADPAGMAWGDKQYDSMVWYRSFRLEPGEKSAFYRLRLCDDFDAARRAGREPQALLTLGLQGRIDLDDVTVHVNGSHPLQRTDRPPYNQSDHGSWTDIVQYAVPVRSLVEDENRIELRRAREHPGYAGAVEVRKCILELDWEEDPRSALISETAR